MLDAKRLDQIYDQLIHLYQQYEIMDEYGKGFQIDEKIQKLKKELSEIRSEETKEELKEYHNA